MKHKPRTTVALVLLGLLTSSASAHYSMLLPQTASAKRDRKVPSCTSTAIRSNTNFWMPLAIQDIFVLTPDSKKSDLSKGIDKDHHPRRGRKMVSVYRWRFTPGQRGDYVFVLSTPPVWMEEEHEFWQDTVKVVLHVQAQKGWDAVAGQPLEMVPLTRLYGS